MRSARVLRILPALLPLALLACALAGGLAATPTQAPPPVTEPPAPPPPTPEPTVPPVAPPTAGPTSVIPIPPTHVVSPQVTPVDGWLTYHNTYLGYAFDYPPEAAIVETGVSGYPTEMLPPGMDPGQFIDLLESSLPANLCVSAKLPAAWIVVAASPAAGGDFAGPCGVTGIGAYDIKNSTELVSAGGQQMEARLTEVFDKGTAQKLYEFAFLQLEDGTRIQYGNDTQSGMTIDDYMQAKPTILRILASFRWEK
jgi:hypothetical protein